MPPFLTRTKTSKSILIGVGCLFILSLAWYLWNQNSNSPDAVLARMRNDPQRIFSYRPGLIDHRRVETMDLTLNGNPLFPGPHQVRYKDCVIEGIFKPTSFGHPERPFNLDFYISLRNSNTSDGDWALIDDDTGKQRQWSFNANQPNSRVRQFNHPDLRKYFEPGTYRADLYFEIDDFNMGQNEVYLLGTTTITLREDQ